MCTSDLIKLLEKEGYEYILGARIKAESGVIKRQILALNLANGQSAIVQKDDKTKIIVSYSEARARKDEKNRARGLAKLEKQIKSGRLTKAQINNRGYNKFLELENQVNISINETKIKEDQKWDGL